jgi:hypothetical protein
MPEPVVPIAEHPLASLYHDFREFLHDLGAVIVRVYVSYRVLVIGGVAAPEVAFVTALGAGAADIFERSARWMPRTRKRIVDRIKKVGIL